MKKAKKIVLASLLALAVFTSNFTQPTQAAVKNSARASITTDKDAYFAEANKSVKIKVITSNISKISVKKMYYDVDPCYTIEAVNQKLHTVTVRVGKDGTSGFFKIIGTVRGSNKKISTIVKVGATDTIIRVTDPESRKKFQGKYESVYFSSPGITKLAVDCYTINKSDVIYTAAIADPSIASVSLAHTDADKYYRYCSFTITSKKPGYTTVTVKGTDGTTRTIPVIVSGYEIPSIISSANGHTATFTIVYYGNDYSILQPMESKDYTYTNSNFTNGYDVDLETITVEKSEISTVESTVRLDCNGIVNTIKIHW